LSPLTRSRSLPLAALENHVALVAAHFDAAVARRGHGLAVAPPIEHEHVARAAVVGRVTLDEEGAAAVGRGLELARRDARDVGAALVALAQLVDLPVAPGPDEQRQQCDHQQQWCRQPQHGPGEAQQADAAGEPDHHLAVAVHARQRRDDGDEQRQAEDGRQVLQRDVAEQQHDVLGGDRAARGLAQRADQEHRDHDGQDDDERRAEGPREVSAQGRIE
jgi:hypothetical protein